jgi:dienelactone hydrolase
MDADPYFVDEGDIDAARPFVEATAGAELFLYPGGEHLFTDSSLTAYDEALTAVVLQRSLAFLDRL